MQARGREISPDRTWICGSFLIAGSLLVGVSGLFHPVLAGDSASQLMAIAATRGWRAIHWSIAFGYVVTVAGLTISSALHGATPGALAARIGASLAIFCYAVSLVGVLFMLGGASVLAAAYPERADAVFLFDALHPFALAALRIGAFAVSFGLCAFGWAVRTGRLWPSWIGWLGVAAGIAGGAIGIFLPEHSPATIAGIALAAIWGLLLGALLVARAARR